MNKFEFHTKLLDFIDCEMHSAYLSRNHRDQTLSPDYLSMHHWMVTMLALKFKPDISRNALIYAMTHDIGEHFTGDMPSPVKRSNPALEQIMEDLEREHNPYYDIRHTISEDEKNFVEFCDSLAYLLFVYNEIKLGNKYYKQKLPKLINTFTKFRSTIGKEIIDGIQLFEKRDI